MCKSCLSSSVILSVLQSAANLLIAACRGQALNNLCAKHEAEGSVTPKRENGFLDFPFGFAQGSLGMTQDDSSTQKTHPNEVRFSFLLPIALG